ncbi:pseudouridine-5-phosphate glycosidase [Anoxybacter fermentans]|uniref:Pseudouridine-5'-phosphate glycosidase n=1 Tax=Anoxybacter fermentans TaxID=1323375 RepID=A0A3S9SXQ2_9FIRM|nr:pseudouridine-5'-phosphate glycosidase [Anoxybacter fermentans]AZR73126.1 pseudouridine-5-phosphate glycosidase [Anoxybacter fermentans]
MEKYMIIHPEVKKALDAGKAVVALESTIISHGMPYPENVKTARTLEELVRSEGAVPATIGILNGKIKIGLNEEELEILGTKNEVIKVSRRDLPVVIAQKKHGATTVAATMFLANLAGIRIFATGGIGGVHRGAETSFDISADLTELGMTNVAVICAGAKAILDLPLTLERLETLGVPVLGYGTDEFPAFYSRKSGLKVDQRIDTPEQLARILKTKWDLGLNGGVLITNPIPEEAEIPAEEINDTIETALKEAETLGIKGKKITPFLLNRIKELTNGRSLTANIELVKNNAKLAAQIAVEYAKLT